MLQQPKATDSKGRVFADGDRPVVVAKVSAETQSLTVQRKTHGTFFSRTLHVIELARLLDPEGTTVAVLDG